MRSAAGSGEGEVEEGRRVSEGRWAGKWMRYRGVGMEFSLRGVVEDRGLAVEEVWWNGNGGRCGVLTLPHRPLSSD